jgi:hypothetical protein
VGAGLIPQWPSLIWNRRQRGYGYERGQRAYNMDREYKQEYRQGNCKIERK